MAELWCWRHPRATGAALPRHCTGVGQASRCIGRTDSRVDPRRAKRLAHRIRTAARRNGLPREVWVSTLQRSAAVGRWLSRWGWRVHVDARLCELDFGRWDGLLWSDIAWADVEAWQADLLHHAPGGGESLLALAARVQAFVADCAADAALRPAPRLLVGHGGWINALLHLPALRAPLDAARWPAPPPHDALRRWTSPLR